MLDFVLRNQDAIILGAIFLILGGAIGPLLSSLFKKEDSQQQRPITLTQIIEIDNSRQTNNNYAGTNRVQPDDEMPVIMFVMVASCFGYIYWRQEILLTLTSLSLFSIGLFIGSAIYAYINDAIDGAGWTVYLLFACGVAIFSFVLIASAIKPMYAPEGLDSFQTIFRQQNLSSLIEIIEINTVTWLIMHVSGVFLLFYAQFRLSLSLGHYLAVVNLSSAPTPSRLALWFAAKTKKYSRPMWNGVTLTVSCLLSFILINGYGHLWFNSLFIHN